MITFRFSILAVTAAVALALGPSSASAAVLTFDGDICGGPCFNGAYIDSNYGSGPNVAVSYNHDITNGSPGNQLQWWSTQYSDLTNVAYGSNNGNSGTPEVFLKPLNGGTLTLNSFDLGAWPNTDRATQVTIVDGNGNVVFSLGLTIPGVVHEAFIGPISSSTGFGIEWGPDGWNVGIDNIDFSVTGAVPEPSTWAMMMFGFAAVGFLAWRSKPRLALSA